MAENITLKFRVEGKRGMQRALESVQGSLSGLEDTTASANVAVQEQDSALKKVGKAAHNAHLAHSAYKLTQHGVAVATGNTVTATSGLTTAMAASRSGVEKMSVALKATAARLGAVAARAAPAAAALAPLAIGAGIVGGMVVVNKKLIEVGRAGAGVASLSDSFDNLAEHVGTTGSALRQGLSQATAGAVSNTDLMRTSIIALNSEAIKSPEILTEVAENARILGRSVGEDTSEAFDRIVRAIGTMNPQLLKSLGAFVSVEEATRKYAEAHGLAASELTDHQKKAAFTAAVLDRLRASASRVTDETGDLATSQQRVAAAAENFSDGIESAVSRSENLKQVGEDMATIKVETLGLAESFGEDLVEGIADASAGLSEKVTGPLADWIEGAAEAARGTEDLNRSLLAAARAEPVKNLAEQMGDGISVTVESTSILSDLGDELERINDLQTAMGDLFDANSRKQTALGQAIRDAIDQGWDPMSEAVQSLVGQLEAFNVMPEQFLLHRRGERVRGPAFMGAGPGEGGAPVGRVPDVGMPSIEPPEGMQEAAASFEDAGEVAITSFGAMAEAAIRGSEQMETSLIRGISNIVSSLPGVAGSPWGAAVGAVGGILSSVIGRSSKPQRVSIADMERSATNKFRRSVSGPETVQVVLVDPRGNEISRVSQKLRERSARDAVDRLPVGT